MTSRMITDEIQRVSTTHSDKTHSHANAPTEQLYNNGPTDRQTDRRLRRSWPADRTALKRCPLGVTGDSLASTLPHLLHTAWTDREKVSLNL